MAIEKKLICFARLAEFERQLAAGNILDYSIILIQDAKKIYNRGTYYDCNNVIPDWNAGEGEEGYIKNRTHFRIKGELIATLDAGDGGTVVLNGALPFLIENTSMSEGHSNFREVIVSKLDTEFEVPSIGPSIKAKITYDGTNYIYEQLTTYGISNILNFHQSAVAPLQDWAIPDTIVRKTDLATKTSQLENDSNFVSSDGLKTINNQSLLGIGNIEIESGGEENVQSDWNVTDTSSDAYIKNKPTIPTKTSQLTNDSNFLDKDTADGSYVAFEKFGEIDFVAQVKAFDDRLIIYALPTSATGDEDDVIATRETLKTINGESIVGSGDIEIGGGGVSEDYVNTAIANAITTTLNTAV